MTDSFPKLGGRALTDLVSDSLRDAILDGRFKAGEKLDQYVLAGEFGVSRTPIREALRRLESEGLVEIRPQKGAFIRMPSRLDIVHIIEVRRLIEAEVAKQVAPSLPEQVIRELYEQQSRVREQLNEGDTSAHFAEDIRFHDTLTSHAENSMLKEVLDALNNRIVLLRRFLWLQPGSELVGVIEEHLAILEAIECRDPELASTRMSLHLGNSANRLQRLLGQAGEAEPIVAPS